MKPARKPPNKGRNGPGVMGRPRVDQELLARAVAMVEAGSHTCEEAGEEIGRLTGTRLGGNTVRRAVKAKEAAEEGVIVAASQIGAEEALEIPGDVKAAIVTVADSEKARAVRRLVQGMGGKWDGEAVEALAATWSCAVEDVRALVLEAAILAGAQVLPPELAREESLAVARRARDKADAAADWKSVLLAQAHIDGLQLKGREGEGLTKAQAVALFREILAAVAPFPGAREAAIAVMFPGG